tara:strand:+ start:973 stop:1257 length:285 start_codon:yes stop_codon:yes gene_type:complete
MNSKRLMIILSIVLALLSIPFVAMQFTDEVVWDIVDFTVMGILLLGTALLCELVLRKIKTKSHRIILCALVLFGFLLVWAELAVGVFETPFAGS